MPRRVAGEEFVWGPGRRTEESSGGFRCGEEMRQSTDFPDENSPMPSWSVAATMSLLVESPPANGLDVLGLGGLGGGRAPLGPDPSRQALRQSDIHLEKASFCFWENDSCGTWLSFMRQSE